MLAFAVAAVDDPDEGITNATGGAELYAHPSPALSAAQGLAAATGLAALDGTPLVILVVVYCDDETWAPCCPICFTAVGDVHASVCDRTGGVMPHEAVVRPYENVIGTRKAFPTWTRPPGAAPPPA